MSESSLHNRNPKTKKAVPVRSTTTRKPGILVKGTQNMEYKYVSLSCRMCNNLRSLSGLGQSRFQGKEYVMTQLKDSALSHADAAEILMAEYALHCQCDGFKH